MILIFTELYRGVRDWQYLAFDRLTMGSVNSHCAACYRKSNHSSYVTCNRIIHRHSKGLVLLSDVTHADVKVVTELQIRGLSSRVFHCKFAEDISDQVLQTTHKQLKLVINHSKYYSYLILLNRRYFFLVKSN